MSSEFPDSSKSMLARPAAHSLAAIATSCAPSSTRNSSSMPNCLAKLVVIPWRKFPMLISVPNTTRFSWRPRLTSDSHSVGAAHHALDHQVLDLADGARRIQAFRTHVNAVHDRITAKQPVRVFQVVEALVSRFIARICEKAISLQQSRGPHELVRVPPE